MSTQAPRQATILELLREVATAAERDDPDAAERAVTAFRGALRRTIPPDSAAARFDELLQLAALDGELRTADLEREAFGCALVRLFVTRQRGRAADQADLN